MMMLSTEGQVLAPLLLREHFPRVLCIECIVDNAYCALEELLCLLAWFAFDFKSQEHYSDIFFVFSIRFKLIADMLFLFPDLS